MEKTPKLSYYSDTTYGENVRVNFYDRTDESGNSHVALELKRHDADGPSWVFRTDLDQLEAVASRADAIRRNPGGLGAPERTEKIGEYDVTFIPWPVEEEGEEREESLAFYMQSTTGGRRQEFATTLDRLKDIIDDGREVERELDYGQKPWSTVVYSTSVKDEGDGHFRGTVFKSTTNREEALMLVSKNRGFALFQDTRRMPLEKGDHIDFEAHSLFEVGRVGVVSAESMATTNKLAEERLGKHFLVARWNYKDSLPSVGQHAVWSGEGMAYNDVFEHFKARPIGAKDQDPGRDIFVVLEQGERNPFAAKVAFVTYDEREAISRMETLDVAMQKDVELQDALRNDFASLQLGMEARRKEFTVGM